MSGLDIKSSPTFRIVGVVLGQDEAQATALHVGPRLEKAKLTAMRLRSLDLPAALCSLLWRVRVRPQALYGSDIRDVPLSQLTPLASLGKSLLGSKAPLQLNAWRSPEVLCGPPLGDTSLKAPAVEVRERQLEWLQVLVNLSSLAGYVHRVVAWRRDRWEEPTCSLRAALRAAGWSVRRNRQCLRATQWPKIDQEVSYPGDVRLHPEDSFPLSEAVFTDGSLAACGGAAAVQESTGKVLQARLPTARSSTQCELAALCLALTWNPVQILTDSLCSLQLLLHWGEYAPRRVLACPDRVSVRQVISLASECPAPPLLEKVQAHDEAGIALGHPKAMGNDMADQEAKKAANDPWVPVWSPDASLYGDPVEILDASGSQVMQVKPAYQQLWWRQQVTSRATTRAWLQSLYPDGMEVDWPLSIGIFRRPTSSNSHFHHPAPPSVIKWIARVRTGSLATRARRHKQGLSGSPECPCCAAEVEDDAHVIAGCPATGSSDWPQCVMEAWTCSGEATGLHPIPPDMEQLGACKLQLMAALIPSNVVAASLLPPSHQARFFGRLHKELAARTAQFLGRREALISRALEEPPGVSTVAAPQ